MSPPTPPFEPATPPGLTGRQCPLHDSHAAAICERAPRSRRRANSLRAKAINSAIASGSNLNAQLVHVEDARQPVPQCLIHIDHEAVVDVVPGLDDLQLRFHLGQPTHHVDLEQ